MTHKVRGICPYCGAVMFTLETKTDNYYMDNVALCGNCDKNTGIHIRRGIIEYEPRDGPT